MSFHSRLQLALVLVATTAAIPPAFAVEPPGTPGVACLADERIEDILRHAGVVYLAGRFTHVRPPGTDPGDPEEVERRWFAACDAATGAVLPWNPLVDCLGGGSGCTNSRGQSLALAPGGTEIFLGGKFDTVAGAAQKQVVRVSLATAARNPAFAPEPNDRVQRVVLAPDGARLYIAGNFTRIDACTPSPCHEFLAAVDPATGDVIAEFDPLIETVVPADFKTVYSLAFSTAGDVLYIGGQFDRVNGEIRTSVAAITLPAGTTTLAFAPHLSDANPEDTFVQIYDLRLDDDWLYVCGDWWATGDWGDQHDQRNVNRFHPVTGEVDEDFWIATDGGVQACDLDHGLGLLFVGGHFDCVRAWIDRTTPVDPAPAQCGTDPEFVGTQQRDLFALRLRDGELLAWNPDTSGVAGTWAVAASVGHLDVGGQLGWPRVGPPTHSHLLTFALPLFADDFEGDSLDRWSSSGP